MNKKYIKVVGQGYNKYDAFDQLTHISDCEDAACIFQSRAWQQEYLKKYPRATSFQVVLFVNGQYQGASNGSFNNDVGGAA